MSKPVAETQATEMKPDMALIPMLVLTLVVMTLFIIAQLAYLNPAHESLKRIESMRPCSQEKK